MPDRSSPSATDPLDVFAFLEAERSCVNTRLKQGIKDSVRKGDINSHTLMTLGAFQPGIQGPGTHFNRCINPITYYTVSEPPPGYDVASHRVSFRVAGNQHWKT